MTTDATQDPEVLLEQPRRRFIRPGLLPTMFCAGCGGGTVLNCFTAAVEAVGIPPERLCSVTGIGCSSWVLSPYFKADTLHTTHGRAIAFATGVKVARPDLEVVVIAGDGDLSGIGGNHIIHAARRNVEISVVMINNSIYGMTGGQAAPSTPTNVRTTTTPYGNPEPPVRAAELVTAAGASYVARWTTAHIPQLINALKTLINHNGFGFVEVVAPCTTSFGKAVGRRNASEFMAYYRDHSIPVAEAGDYLKEAPDERIVVGTFVHRSDQPKLTKQLDGMAAQAQERTGVAP